MKLFPSETDRLSVAESLKLPKLGSVVGGQRELIIGDRQTDSSWVIFQAINLRIGGQDMQQGKGIISGGVVMI